jgi:hypothetical protein
MNMIHQCNCGETDITKFRLRPSGSPRKECRKCENKARHERKKKKKDLNSNSATDSFTKVQTNIKKNDLTGELESIVTTVGIPADPEEFMRSKGIDTDKYQLSGGEITCNTQPMKLRNSEGEDVPTLVEYYRVYSKFTPKLLKPVQFEPVAPVEIKVYNTVKNVPTIKNNLKKYLIIPDSQNGYSRNLLTGKLTPFHDRRCWDIAFQVAQDWQPDHLIFLGDMVDLPDYSDKFLSSPELKFLLQPTIYELGFIIGKLRSICPNAQFDWVEGNHEQRFNRAILANFQASYGVKQFTMLGDNSPKYDYFSLPGLLNLERLNVNYIGDYPHAHLTIGKSCEVIHGIKVKSKGGETAKSYLHDYPCSVIYGHIHRCEKVWRTIYFGDSVRYIFAASPGTFATVGGETPAVNKRSDWQNGLMKLTYDPEHDRYDPKLVHIINGTAIDDGVEYQGNYDMEELQHSTSIQF